MSSNSNFKKDKCWSCEFFSGKREYKKGWFGDSVETEGWGICANRSSFGHNNKKVQDDDWCSCYQKWGVLQSAIARKEDERIQAQAERGQRQAIERQNREHERQVEELRRERNRLEEERKRIEYERWYNSLSLEQRQKEDERIATEKAQEEELRKQRAEKQELKEYVEKKTRKYYLIGAIIISILAISLFISIFFLSEHKSFLGIYDDYYAQKYPDNVKQLKDAITRDIIFIVLEVLALITTIGVMIFKIKKAKKSH